MDDFPFSLFLRLAPCCSSVIVSVVHAKFLIKRVISEVRFLSYPHAPFYLVFGQFFLWWFILFDVVLAFSVPLCKGALFRVCLVVILNRMVLVHKEE